MRATIEVELNGRNNGRLLRSNLNETVAEFSARIGREAEVAFAELAAEEAAGAPARR